MKGTREYLLEVKDLKNTFLFAEEFSANTSAM